VSTPARVTWERAAHGYTADVGRYLLLVIEPAVGGPWTWEVCARVGWYDAAGTAPDVDAAMREAVRVVEELGHD
jgi:hypothetical protein